MDKNNAVLVAAQKAIELSQFARALASTRGTPMDMTLAAYRNAIEQWRKAAVLCNAEATVLMASMGEEVRHAR